MNDWKVLFVLIALIALIVMLAAGCTTPGCPPGLTYPECWFGHNYDAPPAGKAVVLQEATPEPAPEATEVVVVDVPTEEEPPADPWLKPEHIIFIVAFVLLGFSHPPQTGKLFGDIMQRVQEAVRASPTTADDTLLAIVKPALDQVQARLDKVDAALATVVGAEDAKG